MNQLLFLVNRPGAGKRHKASGRTPGPEKPPQPSRRQVSNAWRGGALKRGRRAPSAPLRTHRPGTRSLTSSTTSQRTRKACHTLWRKQQIAKARWLRSSAANPNLSRVKNDGACAKQPFREASKPILGRHVTQRQEKRTARLQGDAQMLHGWAPLCPAQKEPQAASKLRAAALRQVALRSPGISGPAARKTLKRP